MARLQDFPNVTPTSSDNLLVVQSGGQGLASIGSTLGAKMDKNNPTGTGSLSLGRMSGTSTGNGSLAVGSDCEASGNQSMAQGLRTTATGLRAVAIGQDNTASGSASFAYGINSTASGAYANASGLNTIANHRSQHTFGEYNTADTSTAASNTRGTYIEIVGKGTSDSNRSNARTLDWSGNEVLAGNLTINGNQSLSTVTSAIFTYRFNSSANIEISAFEYSSFIFLGYAQGIGSVAILLTINNGSIQNVINMKNGNAFSSADLTFTFANSKLTISSTKTAYSTLTVIKGSP